MNANNEKVDEIKEKTLAGIKEILWRLERGYLTEDQRNAGGQSIKSEYPQAAADIRWLATELLEVT